MIAEKAVLRASQWCYQGVWAIATSWFDVPEHPPQLTGADDSQIQSFRPAAGFLQYLKLFFWIGLVVFDGLLLVGWIVLLVAAPLVGIVLAPIIWAVMIIPDIVVYIALHLRYDTTWYVLSDRSMRIRRGIWTIHETTITYDNIQNVSIRQGPVQRHFGISDVVVETAGGGGGNSGEHGASMSHSGLLEGIGNAQEVRKLILRKWRASPSSGLGDESPQRLDQAATLSSGQCGWDAEQVELLEQIRDLTVSLKTI